jgi:hypothetical protein
MSGETKEKHTPGDWTIDGLRIIRNGTQPTGLFNVADCADPTANQRDGNIEERIANAKLIAAAPELLSCLREVLNMAIAAGGLRGDDVQYGLGPSDWIDGMDRAIKTIQKARGVL